MPKLPACATVVLETAKGTIEIETLPGDAPKSVARSLELANTSIYRQQNSLVNSMSVAAPLCQR